MKSFTAVDFPVKPYVKAYLHSKLGATIVLKGDRETINEKFIDLLKIGTNERRCQFRNSTYQTTIRLYIPVRLYRKKGLNLNETNVKSLNSFIECEIKEKFYFFMDFFMGRIPCFENNLPEVRRLLGINVDAWKDDTMRKVYWKMSKTRKN